MIIKRIKIEKFESVDRYETLFDPDVAVLGGTDPDVIFKAIGVILKNGCILRSLENIRDGTYVEAEVDVGGGRFRLSARGCEADHTFCYSVTSDEGTCGTDFYRTIEKNGEEEDLSWFFSPSWERYSERFMHYREVERHHPSGDLFAPTRGIGLTRTFRTCLNEYLKNDRPYRLSKNRDQFIRLWKDGNCTVTDRTTKEVAALSESERFLFEFLCFIKLNEFWEQVEKIRDPDHEKLPFMIREPFDRLDVTKDFPAYLKLAQKQGRQIFIRADVPMLAAYINK